MVATAIDTDSENESIFQFSKGNRRTKKKKTKKTKKTKTTNKTLKISK